MLSWANSRHFDWRSANFNGIWIFGQRVAKQQENAYNQEANDGRANELGDEMSWMRTYKMCWVQQFFDI